MALIKYVIVDDHAVIRQGLRYVLADDHRLKFVGEAENGQVLMELLEKARPDVILLDIKMPNMDGVEAVTQIRSRYPTTKILMFTSYDDEYYILHLLEKGVNGYLLKDADPDEIKRAIHTVNENDYYFNTLVSSTMLKIITQKNTTGPKTQALTLTQRETEVLQLICQQLTAAEIGEKIFLSPRTVEGIRADLIEKTGAKNTVGLVLYALRNGIVN